METENTPLGRTEQDTPRREQQEVNSPFILGEGGLQQQPTYEQQSIPKIGRYEARLSVTGLHLTYEDAEDRASFSLLPSEVLALANYISANKTQIEESVPLEENMRNLNLGAKPFRIGKGPKPFPTNTSVLQREQQKQNSG